MQITKSDYLLYLNHPAWFWLKKNDPKKLPKPDAALQAIFDAGYLFEAYAEKLFPDALKLNWDGFEEYRNLPKKTQEAIISGAKTIFQGRFETNEATCIIDVVDFKNKNTLDLYEIKSTSSVKSVHEHDLAFQTIVLEDSGYKVKKIAIITVNGKYVRSGEINPKDITTVTDVTEKVRKRIDSTRENIKKAIKVAKESTMPDPSPSKCGPSYTAEWINIYKSLKGIKKGDGSIYDIYSPSATLIGKLEEAGLKRMSDVPVDFLGLTDKQRWQIKATKKDKIFIDKERIKEFIDKVKYPIYFLDYETLSSVIPCFDGHRPYQQIPFQYSLHVIDGPGKNPRHFEYLHTKKSDPVGPLSESLSNNIGSGGTVLVWWESFEKGCNSAMGELQPKYKKFYESVNSRIIDLIEPFFNYYYVDKDFFGSSSIKDVLPVIVPELSYNNLEITDGSAAQRIWMETVLGKKNNSQKEKIFNDLLAYCNLDTLAMVRIWEFLQKIK